jgi:hypothetical protein
MEYSRGFVSDNPDFRCLRVSENDNPFKRVVKRTASYLTSSVKFTVTHSYNIRRYITLKSSDDSGTIDRIHEMSKARGVPDSDVLGIISADNGSMVSHMNVPLFSEKMATMVQRWMTAHAPPARNTHMDSGFYKKVIRLTILFDHVKNIYSDKYNVYQAAYVHEGFSFRATLCFVMQIVSIVALVQQPNEKSADLPRTLLDDFLLVVTLLYMFFNIPANYVTSNMSHSIILLHVFYGLGMYPRMVFVVMDMIINTILMSFMPIISARLLSATTLSTSIVTRSLSVMFITGLDDKAVTKGESNRFLESQNNFLKDMVERVDHYRDSDGLYFIMLIPWLENLALLVSLMYAYFLLFVTYN